MFGLFFAALCGIGLVRLWRPRRFGWFGGFGYGPPRVERLIRYLRANGTQEAAIRQSVDEVSRAFRAFNPKARAESLTAALTSETFDREQLLNQMREPEPGSLAHALVNAVERLRGALDTNQRFKLAGLLAGRRHGHCH